MEYIQGNSIATMLARKEGFSIWDLLDIGRQVCSGLDHAHSHKVFHYSLEPAKIMCGWDGTVRILSYGVSSVGKFTAQMPGVPSILHYMSPEQVRGESIDARSNLFSLGAMFYEMVTDRKAFDREDAESLRQSILESTPVPPMHVNPKTSPGAERSHHESARQRSGGALPERQGTARRSGEMQGIQTAGGEAGSRTRQEHSRSERSQSRDSGEICRRPAAPAASAAASRPQAASPPRRCKASRPKRNSLLHLRPARLLPPRPDGPVAALHHPHLSSRPLANAAEPSASMSSAVLDEPAVEAPEVEAPQIAVDPMMAEGGTVSRRWHQLLGDDRTASAQGSLHSAASATSAVFEQKQFSCSNVFSGYEDEPEKPKVQPREVAEKAIKEIKNVPPQLMIYSIAGAAVVILIIAVVPGPSRQHFE